MVAAFALTLLAPLSAVGQEADWRGAFAAGEAARRDGDAEAYAAHMAEAVEGMPDGYLNRPFAQYHAARAFALLSDAEAAIRFLDMAWREGIESLMISFAHADPAFDALRRDEAFREVMARADTMTLHVTHLGGTVHLLHGAGAQVVASVGPDGVLLVDTGYGAALPAVRRALAGLGGREVDRVILTHPHEDHWGGVADLAGEALLYAHPATREALGEPYTFMEGVVLPPRPDEVRRGVAAARQGSFPFNGEEVRWLPVEAHTGGDVAVLFPRSRVVHMGDAYLGGNPMMFPGGEDPEGFLDRMDALLDGLPEGTVVVGGHDAPVGVQAVRDQVAESRACMSAVGEALAAERSLDETLEETGDRFPAGWVRFFYGALGGER